MSVSQIATKEIFSFTSNSKNLYIFLSRISWSTVSNALDKTTNTQQLYKFRSMFLTNLSYILLTAKVVEWFSEIEIGVHLKA